MRKAGLGNRMEGSKDLQLHLSSSLWCHILEESCDVTCEQHVLVFVSDRLTQSRQVFCSGADAPKDLPVQGQLFALLHAKLALAFVDIAAIVGRV